MTNGHNKDDHKTDNDVDTSEEDFAAGNFIENCYQTRGEMEDDISDNDSSIDDAPDADIADQFTTSL